MFVLSGPGIKTVKVSKVAERSSLKPKTTSRFCSSTRVYRCPPCNQWCHPRRRSSSRSGARTSLPPFSGDNRFTWPAGVGLWLSMMTSTTTAMATPAQAARILRPFGVCNRGGLSSRGGTGIARSRGNSPGERVRCGPLSPRAAVGPPGVPSAHAVQPGVVLSLRACAAQPLAVPFPQSLVQPWLPPKLALLR